MNGYEHFQMAEDLALAQSEPYGPAPGRASDPPQRRVLKKDANPDAIRLATVHALLAIESSIPVEPIRVFPEQEAGARRWITPNTTATHECRVPVMAEGSSTGPRAYEDASRVSGPGRLGR